MLKDEIEENYTLRDRLSVVCIEILLGCQVERRHPCDSGCRFGLETQRQGAPRLEKYWQLARASLFVIVIGR